MKRTNLTITGFILLLALTAPVEARSTELSVKLDNILAASCLDKTRTAIRVVKLINGDLVYAKNSDEPLLPASTMKLVTTATALDRLGPGYTFKTGVYYTGVRKPGRIDGDIYIRGGGDPKLTPETVWRIAKEVRRRGIVRVTGDLVADDTFFDQLHNAPSWEKNRSHRAYDAKIGALSVNFNTIAVHVFPGLMPKDPLIVATDPEIDHALIVNRGKTISAGRRSVSIKRKIVANEDLIVVTGTMRPNDKPKLRYIAVSNPPLFAGVIIKKNLEQNGVVVEGSVRVGKTPTNAKLLFTHESEPLADILRQLNRYSNNFISEQIAKTVAAEASSEAGTHALYFDLVLKFLKKEGVNIDGAHFADASGLSRQNRITTRTLTDLFVAMRGRYDLWNDFAASLGLMGIEGSMKERLDKSSAKKFVRAKTGSLNGTSNIAGVMETKGGQLLTFAIFLNDNQCGYDFADEIEDRIITSLYER